MGQQHDDRTSKACMNFAGSAFRHRIERRQPGQPPRKFIEPAHGAHAARGNSCLLAHPTGQCGADHRDDQKNHQRQQLIGFGNGERVDRRNEKEIVGEKR